MEDLFCQTNYGSSTLVCGIDVFSNIKDLTGRHLQRELYSFTTYVFGHDVFPNAKSTLWKCRNIIAVIGVQIVRLGDTVGTIYDEFALKEILHTDIDTDKDILLVHTLNTDATDEELKLLYDNFYKLICFEAHKNYSLSDNVAVFIPLSKQDKEYEKLISVNPSLDNGCKVISYGNGILLY